MGDCQCGGNYKIGQRLFLSQSLCFLPATGVFLSKHRKRKENVRVGEKKVCSGRELHGVIEETQLHVRDILEPV
jgi:hypothetical protein